MPPTPNLQRQKEDVANYGDVKYVEDASVHSFNHLAASNKALTRRLLLKLDFRCVLRNAFYSTEANSGQNHPNYVIAFPLLVSRPNECW